MMSLSEDFFEFILLGIHRAFYMHRLMLFINLGSFWTLFFKYSFCHFLFSPSGIPIMHMLVRFMLSHKYWMFCPFFFILFASCSSYCIILIDLFLSLLILSSANPDMLQAFLVNVYFSITLFNCRMSIWYIYFYLIIDILNVLILSFNSHMSPYSLMDPQAYFLSLATQEVEKGSPWRNSFSHLALHYS